MLSFRSAGRVVIRALRAYEDAGGNWDDVDNLKLSAMGVDWFDWNLDPLGYLADAARITDQSIELTSELLADALRLTHPDCHPPERQDLAHRVTQELLALKPFVFPAPKPKPIAPAPKKRRNESVKERAATLKESLRLSYPCKECASTIPYFYCTACRAEWEKRREDERNRENAKQREQYARRKTRRARWQPTTLCAECGAELKGKRRDARFCSNACRQRANRKAA